MLPNDDDAYLDSSLFQVWTLRLKEVSGLLLLDKHVTIVLKWPFLPAKYLKHKKGHSLKKTLSSREARLYLRGGRAK